MPVTSLYDVQATAQELAAGIGRDLPPIQALLEAGTASARDVRNARATLEGYLADIAALRDDLDATDVSDFGLGSRADVKLRLWRWERDVRGAFRRLAGEMVAAQGTAEDLERGIARRLHVVQTGETLQSLAALYLGDFRAWRRIADANSLTPGPLTRGTVLVIPERE